MNHNHQCSCNHENVKYCKLCQVPYCVDCGKEWRVNLGHYYSYPNTFQYTTTTGGNGTIPINVSNSLQDLNVCCSGAHQE